MKYVFISYTGASFSIAKRLEYEGNEVLVGQVRDPADLRTKGWQSTGESPEHRNRRLSVYKNILPRIDANQLVRELRAVSDTAKKDYFVVLEHNNLARYGEMLSGMGFIGLTPNYDDYEREKDRKKAHEFVRTYYNHLHLLPSQEFSKVSDGVEYVNGADTLLVLKSNGNFGATIVPRATNVELNHAQILGALEGDAVAYEKAGFLLETKISAPLEFAPVLAFWNGKPVYAQVEFECKPMCAADIGPDVGGAINLCLRISLANDSFLDEFFPPIVYEMAKARSGLFLFDAGVLYDPKTKRNYFTEFAGNRWGWGGVFSEMTMAHEGSKVPTKYFEALAKGKSPLRYRFGVAVTLYSTQLDTRFPNLPRNEVPIYCTEDKPEELVYLQHVDRKDSVWHTVGVKNDGDTIGYVTGYGNTLMGAVERAYDAVDKISFDGMIYRCKSDFLADSYPSSIINRLRFINDYYLGNELDNLIEV